MSSKFSPVSKPLASKQPLLEVDVKKKKKKGSRKSNSKALTARALLDEFGLCPISMEPMRRPVLPSSGQAFDEINIVRYCNTGNRRCPVSGATLKFNKGKVAHTVDFRLRNLIRAQAAHAKINVAPIDKNALFKELRTSYKPETAKAIVDDCYLGYIKFSELQGLVEEFSSGHDDTGNEEQVTEIFRALLSECLACRDPVIVNLAIDFIEAYDSAWEDQRVLREALAVAQDPDSRGKILVVLEDKVRSQAYGAAQIKAILTFETESVPVQHFQANIAQIVIQQGGKGKGVEFEPILNLALRVREDLDGCIESNVSIYDVWYMTLSSLKDMRASLDDAAMERLFWRENRMVLQHLAASHGDLLTWHLCRHHPLGLSLCVAAIGGHGGVLGGPHEDEIYSSDEEYLSEEMDAFDDVDAFDERENGEDLEEVNYRNAVARLRLPRALLSYQRRVSHLDS